LGPYSIIISGENPFCFFYENLEFAEDVKEEGRRKKEEGGRRRRRSATQTLTTKRADVSLKHLKNGPFLQGLPAQTSCANSVELPL